MNDLAQENPTIHVTDNLHSSVWIFMCLTLAAVVCRLFVVDVPRLPFRLVQGLPRV